MKKLGTLLIVLAFTSALICIVKAQTPEENMKTFLDSEIPGIKIQFNATAETEPSGNISIALSLKGQTDVTVESFNLSIFGFLNGTDKVLMANVTENNFSLNYTSKEYNCTLSVPENVWGATYGEILLTYSASLGGLKLIFSQLTSGFTMTHVRNVYLEGLENKLQSLNESYQQLNNTFAQLNQTFWESFRVNLSTENLALLNKTYWELQQNYTTLQGRLGELDNTSRAVIILAITTVFFTATTIFLVMRRPKRYW